MEPSLDEGMHVGLGGDIETDAADLAERDKNIRELRRRVAFLAAAIEANNPNSLICAIRYRMRHLEARLKALWADMTVPPKVDLIRDDPEALPTSIEMAIQNQFDVIKR
jgi:hypothetical protein